MTLSKQLRELAGKATQGGWLLQATQTEGRDRGVFIVGDNLGGLVGAALPWPTEIESGDYTRVEANASLITSLVNNIPTILTALELQERLDKPETVEVLCASIADKGRGDYVSQETMRQTLAACGIKTVEAVAPNMYRKKAFVYAEQFLPAENKIPAGVYSSGHGDPRADPNYDWMLNTLEGPHTLRNGDYICTGPNGEQWNVERSIFEATYEPAQAVLADIRAVTGVGVKPMLSELAAAIGERMGQGWQSMDDYEIQCDMANAISDAITGQGDVDPFVEPEKWAHAMSITQAAIAALRGRPARAEKEAPNVTKEVSDFRKKLLR